MDSSIVAIWMTTSANTHFCKISEDVDGRSEAIIEVFLWRTLIGVGSGRIFAACVSAVWIMVTIPRIFCTALKPFLYIRWRVDVIFRRRPLYPTELRGLIQKIFNFTGLQDSNDSIVRRRTLYPGEVRGHIQK